MSKTKKIISLLLTVALIMTMATVAIVSASAATTVYFEDSLGWGNINAYCYGGDGELLGGWPGTACNDEGNGVWSIELNGAPEAIIFHANDDTNQTSNIPFAGDGMIAKLTGEWIQGDYKMVAVAEFQAYGDTPVDTTPSDTTPSDTETTPVTGEAATVYFSNGNGWAKVYIHFWGTEATEWPGVEMEFAFTNDFNQDVYKYTVPAGTTGIIFNDGQDPATQTQDITEGIVNNAGFYIDMNSTQNEQGHWGYGTWEYIPTGEDTTAAQDTTAQDTTAADTTAQDTTAADTTAQDTTAADTTAQDTTAADTTAQDTTAAAEGTSITVNGTKTDVKVGDVVTYVVDLTAARLFENIQAYVTYDDAKLELTRMTSDDPDTEDWEVEAAAHCPNLDGAIFNAGEAGIVKFNASVVKGYDFKAGTQLLNLEFTVKAEGNSEIDLVVEEMTIKGGDESYFTNGQQVITDGITVEEYLVYDEVEPTTTEAETTVAETTEVETTVAETTEVETTVAETTEAETTVAETTEVETTVADTTAADTTPSETEKTEPTTEVVVPTASEDATSKTEATEDDKADTPNTGAAAYIYIVLAVLTMAAFAVVVLRKRVNG